MGVTPTDLIQPGLSDDQLNPTELSILQVPWKTDLVERQTAQHIGFSADNRIIEGAMSHSPNLILPGLSDNQSFHAEFSVLQNPENKFSREGYGTTWLAKFPEKK